MSERPVWIVLRDYFLTFCAWFFLAFLLRDPVLAVYVYLRSLLFRSTVTHALDIGTLLSDIEGFIVVSAALVAVLCVWALFQRKRLAGDVRHPQPSTLSCVEHAKDFSLDPHMVREARKLKVISVYYHDDGGIAALSASTGAKTRGLERAV